jgi:hypothetical protein
VEEQRGTVTDDDDNARYGLAKPGQQKMEVHLVFPEPGQGLQGGLVGPSFELFIGNQTAQSWLPGAWLGVSHPTK